MHGALTGIVLFLPSYIHLQSSQPPTKLFQIHPGAPLEDAESQHVIPIPSPKKLSTRLGKVRELCSTAAFMHRQKKVLGESSSHLQDFTVADIGCDHAQLSVGLIQSDVADNVIAVDRMNSPLNIGRENAHNAGVDVESRIEFRLGDGLDPLRPNDGVKAVCIAGVGARCIIDILESSYTHDGDSEDEGGDKDSLRTLGVEHLVLQPVSPHPQYMIPLRRWLEERHWSIQNETITMNRKRLYLNILASDANVLSKYHDEDKTPKLSDEDLILPSILKNRVHSNMVDLTPNTDNSATISTEVEMWKNYIAEYGIGLLQRRVQILMTKELGFREKK
eukprot:737787_1